METQGIVTEELPNLRCRILLDNGREIIAYVAGKMKLNKIKVLTGDRVVVILDKYGGVDTNRIIRRL